MQKKKSNRKLVLKKDTVRNLDAEQLQGANGGIVTLSLGPLCPTAGCTLTFTPACVTANCMTLGTMCDTHDCRLTFGGCYKA